jgi:hypothetical protein
MVISLENSAITIHDMRYVYNQTIGGEYGLISLG